MVRIQEAARRKIAPDVDEDTIRALAIDPDDYFPTFRDALVNVLEGEFEVRSERWQEIGREALGLGLVKVSAPKMMPPEAVLRDMFGMEAA